LREERKPRVFENRMLRRIFEPKRTMLQVSGVNYIMRSLVIGSPHPILYGYKIDKNDMGGACSAYGGMVSRVRGFGGGRERDHWLIRGVNKRIIIRGAGS